MRGIKFPKECHCISCITANHTNGKVYEDCLFLGGETGSYHCILTEPKAKEELELREKYLEFIRHKKGVEVDNTSVPVMMFEPSIMEEFKRYLQQR
jgi:hypothetical protein